MSTTVRRQRTRTDRQHEREQQHIVLIVDTPEGWQPRSADDIPPSLFAVEQDSGREAEAFVEGFNETSAVNGVGKWAVRFNVDESHGPKPQCFYGVVIRGKLWEVRNKRREVAHLARAYNRLCLPGDERASVCQVMCQPVEREAVTI